MGKSVLREHIEQLGKQRDTVVVSFSRTMHTYLNILKQLAESLQISVPTKDVEKELTQGAYNHVRDLKTLHRD